jgi:hypothetical protein
VSAQYAYFYLMRVDRGGIPEAVPEHVAHWVGLGLDDYVGGPFEDRTGGLITFQADGSRQAEGAVETDPFVRRGLVQEYWLKRWKPEQPIGTSDTNRIGE